MFNPLIGILASSGAVAAGGSYESIATITVGSTAVSNIEFTSIPSTYKHLQIRYICRNAGTSDNTVMTFNGDTGNNYATHYLGGSGSGAFAGGLSTNSFIYTDILTTSSTSFSAAVIDILDYASTSKNKTARTLAGIDLNGSGSIWLASGVWINSSTAINAIKLKPSSNDFQQYSHFALYGIKD